MPWNSDGPEDVAGLFVAGRPVVPVPVAAFAFVGLVAGLLLLLRRLAVVAVNGGAGDGSGGWVRWLSDYLMA